MHGYESRLARKLRRTWTSTSPSRSRSRTKTMSSSTPTSSSFCSQEPTAHVSPRRLSTCLASSRADTTIGSCRRLHRSRLAALDSAAGRRVPRQPRTRIDDQEDPIPRRCQRYSRSSHDRDDSSSCPEAGSRCRPLAPPRSDRIDMLDQYRRSCARPSSIRNASLQGQETHIIVDNR